MTVRTDGPDRAAVRSAVTGREATCCNCYVSGHCCAPDHPPCPVAPGRASGTTRGAVMPDAGRGLSHTRTWTDCGPDFCDECSRAIQEWVPWPCPTIEAVCGYPCGWMPRQDCPRHGTAQETYWQRNAEGTA